MISAPHSRGTLYFLRNAVKLFRKNQIQADSTATTDAPTVIRQACPSWERV